MLANVQFVNSCSEPQACVASPQPGPLIIYDVGQTLRGSQGDMQRMHEARNNQT